MYDYFVNPKTGKFQPWAEVVQEVQYTGAQSMSSIFVPTAETSSLRFFLDLMVDLHKPIMFVGGTFNPAGTSTGHSLWRTLCS